MCWFKLDFSNPFNLRGECLYRLIYLEKCFGNDIGFVGGFVSSDATLPKTPILIDENSYVSKDSFLSENISIKGSFVHGNIVNNSNFTLEISKSVLEGVTMCVDKNQFESKISNSFLKNCKIMCQRIEIKDCQQFDNVFIDTNRESSLSFINSKFSFDKEGYAEIRLSASTFESINSVVKSEALICLDDSNFSFEDSLIDGKLRTNINEKIKTSIRTKKTIMAMKNVKMSNGGAFDFTCGKISIRNSSISGIMQIVGGAENKKADISDSILRGSFCLYGSCVISSSFFSANSNFANFYWHEGSDGAKEVYLYASNAKIKDSASVCFENKAGHKTSKPVAEITINESTIENNSVVGFFEFLRLNYATCQNNASLFNCELFNTSVSGSAKVAFARLFDSKVSGNAMIGFSLNEEIVPSTTGAIISGISAVDKYDCVFISSCEESLAIVYKNKRADIYEGSADSPRIIDLSLIDETLKIKESGVLLPKDFPFCAFIKKTISGLQTKKLSVPVDFFESILLYFLFEFSEIVNSSSYKNSFVPCFKVEQITDFSKKLNISYRYNIKEKSFIFSEDIILPDFLQKYVLN